MFVQVITATTTDREGVARMAERFREEVRPGSIGFLGSTVGVADDGTFIAVARFEDAEKAQQNSERPEQGAMFSELEKYLSDVAFHESSDIFVQSGGGSDDAGFVQVMQGRILDEAAYDKMMGGWDQVEAAMSEYRPDVLGGITVRLADNTYFDVIYFSSEEEARAGEGKEMPAELQEGWAEMEKAVAIDRFIDLKEPWFS